MGGEECCRVCGAAVGPEQQFCRGCGSEIATGDLPVSSEVRFALDVLGKAKKPLWKRLLSWFGALLLFLFLIPVIFPHRDRMPSSYQKACMANMRVLEGSIDMWEMDQDTAVFGGKRDRALSGPGGKPTSYGQLLIPNYIKKMPKCKKKKGNYMYHAGTHSVWCTRHNTVENPTMGKKEAPGPQ